VHPLLSVLSEPPFQIGLEVHQACVNLLPNRNSIELSEHGLMQPFDYTIGLRTLDLGPGMVDVFHGYIQLILVRVGTTTIFSSPIGQDPAQRHFMGSKEGDDLVIE